MDIDELRNSQVELHRLDKADEKYTFYHDETNNIRKLHVGAQGLNVAELNIFVLGGVVHAGERRPIDIQSLRQAMKIQKSAREIKLEHVARGSFLNILQADKLTTFLRWLIDEGLMIHYHELDPLYWSVVDIVDSVLPVIGNPLLLQHHALLKSDLVTVLRGELKATVSLFHRYGYPGIAPESRKPFLDELLELLDHNETKLPELNFYMLKGVLQAGKNLESLVFIEDNPPNVWIENFSIFYLNRIALFKHACHILDTERVISKHLMAIPLTSSGASITNYRFADSQIEPGLQLADIVVGVLGKMHSYFTEMSSDEVGLMRTSLAGISLQNAELLRNLISVSLNSNSAFLHHVASAHDIQKLDIFLRFSGGAYTS